MGCCCYPEPNVDGTHNCSNVSGPSGCPGGLHTEEPCPVIAQCFFVGQLSLTLAEQTTADPLLSLATRPVFMVLFDFRDLVLRRSALGREFLALYHAHGGQALELLKGHPALLRRVLTALLRVTVYAQDALRAHSYSSKDVTAGALKIDATMIGELRALSRDIGAISLNHEIQPMLQRYAEVAYSFDGLTMREVLRLLAPEPLQKIEPAS